ncbi:FAD-binding protein [Nocardia asteroides]|nr:FAD-binding protein [Nocardia asteroides]
MFADVPALDGMLVFDDATRTSDSLDQGNIVSRRPTAVLRPGSVRDIATMIRYCGQYGIEVAARGAAHTVFGQGLVAGLLIEMRSLRRIHSIDADTADVDAGVLWRELTVAAFEQARLTPPVLTGSVDLTVGGTLSVGGVDGNTGHFQRGLQIDNVRELEVVTGCGDIERCSTERNRDLFEAMLGGLGQCGVITRATVDLVPVQPMVRVYRIHYTDSGRFFADLRTLLHRGELDGMYNLWMPPGTSVLYELNAFAHFDPSQPPDDRYLLRGLGVEAATPLTLDLPYVAAIQFVDDVLIAPLKATLNWDRLVKPWFDVWLPDETVEQFVTDVVPTLGLDDIGVGGFFLLIPQRRSAMTRPFYRVPNQSSSDWIYLFDLLSASMTPGPDPAFATAKLARNRRLYDKAVAAGGTRYPISAIEFTIDDWKNHYGDTWPRFVSLKHRYDPHNILAPGVGIF